MFFYPFLSKALQQKLKPNMLKDKGLNIQSLFIQSKERLGNHSSSSPSEILSTIYREYRYGMQALAAKAAFFTACKGRRRAPLSTSISIFFLFSDGGYDIYQQQQQQQQHHDMEMDRRLSLQQQMGSGGLHQVHSSPNITSPSSNNSQPTHPPQPPAAPPAPPASAAPPAPPGRFLFLYNFHGIDPDACNQSRLFCCRISPTLYHRKAMSDIFVQKCV